MELHSAPIPKVMDYPATVGVVLAVIMASILLIVINRFDPTGGALTISLLVVLTFMGVVVFCVFFTVPKDDLTSGAVGGMVAAFGAVVSHWLSRRKGD
jgi:uncharacterized BrkB/YihY/UPF0761 family membrane protein